MRNNFKNIEFIGSSLNDLTQMPRKIKSIDGTFRAVYTVQFKETIYVLHCFKKKSTSGITTPKPDIHLIKIRLKIAVEIEKKKG